MSKYVFDKQALMDKYIDNLYQQEIGILNNTKNKNKHEEILMAAIITSLDKASIFHLCVQQFLIVYTYQDTKNDKNYVSVPVSFYIPKLVKGCFTSILMNLKTNILNKLKRFLLTHYDLRNGKTKIKGLLPSLSWG